MSKIISQETFNDVVKENIEDLDMDENEAISEAVQQFEAQGVNLSNIIKNPKKAAEIIASCEKLKLLSEKDEIEDGTEELIEFSESIKGSISYKLLAAKSGVYSYLSKILRRTKGKSKTCAIESLTQLLDGHPDLLDADGLSLLLELLKDDSAEVCIATLKFLQVSVKKHEGNRSSLVRGDVAGLLRDMSVRWPDNRDVIDGVCAAVCILIQDDDVRVVHGDAHEHARALAAKLLPLLSGALAKFANDVRTSAELLSALTSMIVRNELCIQFHDCNGLKFIQEVMLHHPDDQIIARNSFILLKTLAGSDEVKEHILENGTEHLLINSLDKFHKNNTVAVAACMCLAALSLRSPKNSRQLCTAGAAETIVRCMTHWQQNRNIMKQGCAAIRNQISRCEELKEVYLQLQVDQLLLACKKNTGELEFEAKSVLVDLGCDVKLNEQWRGTGVQLTN